jgi:hypothetical protein
MEEPKLSVTQRKWEVYRDKELQSAPQHRFMSSASTPQYGTNLNAWQCDGLLYSMVLRWSKSMIEAEKL